MAKRGTEFTTKRNMDLALEMVEKNPAMSFRAISLALGLSEGRVSRWYCDNRYNFKDRYEATLKKSFDGLEGLAIQCMGDLIVNGNFNAAKYVLDNKGYAAPKKIEADVNSTVQINIDIDEEE